MRLNPFHKRRRIKPFTPQKKKYKNPFFSKENFSDIFLRTLKIHYGLIILVIFALVYLTFFSNIFQLRFIKVEGCRELNPEQIKEMVTAELAKKRFIFFYENNYFIFNSKSASESIKEKIQKEVGLDYFYLGKKFPATVKVVIREIIPSVTWQSRENFFYIDREGRVAQKVDKSEVNPDFPLIYDVNEFLIHPQEKVINSAILERLKEIKERLQEIKISVKNFQTLKIECPKEITEEENSVNNNLNLNQNSNLNLSSNLNTNENRNNANQRIKKECEPKQELQNSPYIAVLTEDGYLIYFNVNNSIEQQVNSLKLALNSNLKGREKNLNYIDLRFEKRIYYK